MTIEATAKLIDIEVLAKLFPFLLGFDAAGRAIKVGPRLQPMISHPGGRASDIIQLIRPRIGLDFDEISRHEGDVFLASVVGTALSLRGQMERFGPHYFFLAFPWAKSPEALVEVGVQLSDFPPHCALPDLLLLLQSQQMALEDNERLNNKLKLKSSSHAALLAGIPDLILHIDARGRLSNAKESPNVHIRLPATRPLGMFLVDLFPGAVGETLNALRMTALLTRSPQEAEFRGGDSPNHEFEARVSSTPEGDVLMIIRDISARKAMERELVEAREQALHAARVKAEFLATISHELRTPMNGVIGLAELLSQTKLDDEQRDYLARLRRSGIALLDLIDDVLDLSKAEAGKLSLGEEDFTPGELLDEVFSVLWERAESQGIELVRTISSDVPARLRGDPKRLKQLLFNLAGNAVKFTHQGSVHVSMSLTDQRSDGVTLRCEVVDTGIGISERDQSILFAPFVQVDAAQTRRYGGTGLGLSICKHLVHLMGGAIGVSSEVGAGSKFWFTANLRYAEEPAAVSSEVLLSGRRFLLVGGAPATQRMLSGFLTTWGLRFESADLEHSLRRIDQSMHAGAAIDLVILVSPEPSAFTSFMANLASRSAPPKVVVVDVRPGMTVSGADGVVARPVRQSLLLDTLTTLLVSRAVSSIPSNTRPNIHGVAGMRVLVVDDNSTNRLVLSGLLRRYGALVDEADCGRAAIEAQRDAHYPLIFMDVQMPEMDGFEATAGIRALGFDTTIVAVTANAMPEDRELCLSKGMDLYLAKPLRVAELARTLARATGSRVRADSVSRLPRVATPLDVALLAELTGGEDDLTIEFLKGVTRDLPEYLHAARAALVEGDLRRAAAALHPTSGLLRALTSNAVATQVTELDRSLREATVDAEGAQNTLARVQAFVDDLLREIANYLERPAKPT